MEGRTVSTLLGFALCLSMVGAPGPAIAGDASGGAAGEATDAVAGDGAGLGPQQYRPDLWIALCGLSTGCVIDPPPHPWRGNDVYNSTGKRQRVSVRMEDGEGVRFWLRLENDGTQADTLVVQGCKSTRRFVINAVLVGKHKRPDWRARNITRRFKNGTARFDFPPASERKRTFLTLNIVAPTTAEGVTRRCRVSISSQNDATATDSVVAIMTTY